LILAENAKKKKINSPYFKAFCGVNILKQTKFKLILGFLPRDLRAADFE
jgi:hypothetical protein